jgi:hypothetical protein
MILLLSEEDVATAACAYRQAIAARVGTYNQLDGLTAPRPEAVPHLAVTTACASGTVNADEVRKGGTNAS